MNSILVLIHDIPDAREPGLAHLCEFIEDCEFTYLSTQILHLLGESFKRQTWEVPQRLHPSRVG